MEGRSSQYKGDLSQTALPEMLFTIDRFQVPGVIEVEWAGVTKRVYIKEGNVIHASSTDLADSLGSYLHRTGKLSAEDFASTMREREKLNERYGVILLKRRLLSPVEIYQAIREQIEAVVWSLFYWDQGKVLFSIGEFKEADMVRIQLPMRQVILQGIKRAPNAKALVARLGKRETVFEPTFRYEDLIDLAMGWEEVELLNLVDSKRSLYEICSQGPLNAAENAKLMYAFQVLQLVRRASEEPNASKGKAIRIRMKTEGDNF